MPWLHVHVKRWRTTRIDYACRRCRLPCRTHLALVGVGWVLYRHTRPSVGTTRVEWRSSWGHDLSSSGCWTSLPTVRVGLWLLLWWQKMVLDVGHRSPHGPRGHLVGEDLLVPLHANHTRVLHVMMWGGRPSHLLGRRWATSRGLIVWKPLTLLALWWIVRPSLLRALLVGGVGVGHSES